MATSKPTSDGDTPARTRNQDVDAASQAVSQLFGVTAQALGNAVFNAVNAQQQCAVSAQAALTQTVITMLASDHVVGREASAKLQVSSAPGSGPLPPEPPRPVDTHDLTIAALKAAEEALDPMMALVTLNVACIAMIDAAQHLQRTEIIAETAVGLALQKALTGHDGDTWTSVIAAAEQSVNKASEHLNVICNTMIAITRNAAGRPAPKS